MLVGSGMIRVHRHALSKSEAKEIIALLEKNLQIEKPLHHKSKWEIMQLGKDATLYFVNDKPIAMELGGKLVPFLTALIDGTVRLPRVVVDMGAVKHIANGADVMAPGIVRIEDDFAKDDLVVVVDERHGKPLCIGMALLSKAEIEAVSRGKVIKNLHYVGDKIWNKLKELGLI
ncbi:MAG: DUF1947 domain-containing protein [Candidatus Nezhaarchaeales archaeon]